jgi:SAM-dependent methyltransferase
MAGTSSWHNIGYCVDVMMKIEPESVLDVGAGFGRWGVLAREFCDVWRGRFFPDQWTVRVDAVEAFEKNVCEWHRHFYNQIYVADAAELLTPERCDYDLIILGDVLEHFERGIAEDLLQRCVDRARYVMVNIPLGASYEQGDMYGNVYERHRSVWHVIDFHRRELRHFRLFRDYMERPYGVFVLSRDDPKGVALGLFSSWEVPAATPGEIEQLQARVNALTHELRSILGSRSWRFMTTIRMSLPYRALRRIARRVLRRN